MGSIRNKNIWNNASKRLFGSYSHSGIPGFPFRLFYTREQNSRNIFRNIFRTKFLFRNIPNERALSRRNLKTQQPRDVNLDLCLRKTRGRETFDYRDVIFSEKFLPDNVSVHTKRLSQRFQISPVSKAFLNSSVFVTD